MWRPPGCGCPWAAFSSGAMEAHYTLEHQVVECPGQLPSLPSPKSGPGHRAGNNSRAYFLECRGC